MNSCSYGTDCAGCVSYGDVLLEIKDVNLQFEGRPILRNVNAQIHDVKRRCHIQGQIVGFLGPSGIGKTQLFRIIAGLMGPTSGTVTVGGQATHPGRVGVVAQNYTLFEHRTILGNLLLGAKKKYPSIKDATLKSLDLLSQFGLVDKAHSYPAVLSGGQRQRIAIIQQLLCSEHFLLLDEPFSGLDPVNVDKVCKLLTDISCLDDLNTIIVVSHDVTAISSIADTLWLLGRDRLQDGAPVPGARIQKTYNLVDMGLCWQENIQLRPDFVDFVRQVKREFIEL